MNHTRTLLFALAVGAVTSGCYTNARGSELEQRVLTIEARQDEFRTTFDEERRRLSELALQAEQNIVTLESTLTEARAVLQRTNADLGVRVDTLDQTLNELRGRLEESAFQSAQLRQELELLRQDVEIQINSLIDN